MTAIVSINLGNMAIVVADKKEVFISPSGAIFENNNDAAKIIECDIGLVTGCGLVQLIDPVKSYCANNKINHTNEFCNAIKKEIRKFLNMPGFSRKEKENILQTTAWVVTYRSEILDEVQTRIGFYNTSIDCDNLTQVERNSSRIFFPIDVDKKVREECLRLLPERLDDYSEKYTLEYCVSLAKNIVKVLSQKSRFVSEECDVIVQESSGAIRTIRV